MDKEKIKSWLGLQPYPGGDFTWSALQAEDAAGNLAFMRRFAIFGILIEAFNIFLVLTVSDVKLGSVNNRIYFSLYLILLVLLSIDLIVLYPYRKTASIPVRKINGITFFYCLLFCLWSAAITFQDLQSNNNILVYSFGLIIVAVLFLLKPWQSILIYGTTHIIFLCCLPLTSEAGNRMGVLMNTSIVAFICCCMSFSRYHGHQRQFTNTRIIMEQNKKIQQINVQLGNLLIQDPLTGLYNRRFLTDSLVGKWSDYVRQEQAITAFMLDIDNFKIFNDNYGHQAGDHCLQQLSDTLRASVQGRDCYVIRYGGEEFLLVYFGLGQQQALDAAEALRAQVEATPVAIPSTEESIPVTVSIGVCSAVMHTESNLDTLIHQADIALYRAKAAGRNRVCFQAIDAVSDE